MRILGRFLRMCQLDMSLHCCLLKLNLLRKFGLMGTVVGIEILKHRKILLDTLRKVSLLKHQL